MRIYVTGCARDLGPTRLFDHQVRHANTQLPDQKRFEMLKLHSDPHHSLELEAFTSTRLNGDYRMTVRLSADDVVQLFLACYPELRTALEGALLPAGPGEAPKSS